MNIFVLSRDPEECARFHCDTHLVSQTKETAQMLSTAIRDATKGMAGLGLEIPTAAFGGLNKRTHWHHKCTVWAGETRSNFLWLCDLGEALNEEFEYRRGKLHGSVHVIRRARSYAEYISEGPLTPFAQAMDDEYKDEDAVVAYRNCYNGAKRHLFGWTKRPIPEWIKEERR